MTSDRDGGLSVPSASLFGVLVSLSCGAAFISWMNYFEISNNVTQQFGIVDVTKRFHQQPRSSPFMRYLLVRRGKHVIVITQHRPFGSIFETLQRNLLLDRRVSGHASAS